MARASYKILINTRGGITIDGGTSYGSICDEVTRKIEKKLGQANESSRRYNEAYEDDREQDLHQEI
jgi:hypothetical protein